MEQSGGKRKTFLIIIVIIFGYLYFKEPELLRSWIDKIPSVMGVKASDIHSWGDIQTVLTSKWDEEYVRKQLDTWVVKDGIQLPQGWKLDQVKITDPGKKDKLITVLIPEIPKSETDYIAVKIKAAYKDLLPMPHICTEDPKIVSCVVGDNIETYRAFGLMTYL